MTNKKITQLNSASSVDGTELVEIVQGGTNKKSLLSVIATYVKDVVGNIFDYIQFNTDPPTITDAGTVIWNKQEYTIDVITGLGATIQVGQEMLLLYYNDTGLTITNGSVLHPKSGTIVSGFPIPTPELASASTWELSEGTLSVATHDILNGEIGLATRFGRVRELDTSGISAGTQIWLSDTTPGAFTDTRPVFPSYAISLGGTLNSDASDGEIFVSVTKQVEDTYNDSWDGAIRETFDFLVTSNGTVVTGTLTNADNTKDLTLLFSDGLYTLDVTPGATITLTAGSDTATQTNYVYIPIATKVLTLSTTGFPTTEHCKVAILEVQSAATVQTDGGARRNQNINDHLKTENDNGHILHIAERVRQLNAQWDNGTEATLTGTTTNGYIQVTSGEVWQLHKQTFTSFSMPTDSILIVNDFTTPYRSTTNLNTITAYSTGSSWNNEWSKIVIWGIANKTGEPDFVMCNLPSAGYNSEANAIADGLNYADFTIPDKYKGVGFLIGSFVIRISGGTITYNGGAAYEDLRGFIPNTAAGGGGGGSGITTFLGLTDTPSSYTAGYYIRANSGGTALEEVNQISTNSQTSASSITPTGDARENEEYVTALAASLTINAPSGTPVNGNTLLIRIQDNGTSRTLTWNAIYEIVGTTLPTATTASKKLYVGCIYNSTDTKWDVVSVTEEV